MNELISLIDKLKNAGIQPRVSILIDANTSDVQAIKTLQTTLKNAGVIADVQINLNLGPTTILTTTPATTPVLGGQERFAVRVKESRLNCFTFRKMDKTGKPDMLIREPRVQLQKGAEFFVSASHKIGQHDSGDGTIIGTGNSEYYHVVDAPPNPAAVGLYVRKIDVESII